MAEPVTPNKGYTIPNTGDLVNAWGPVVSGNFSILDSLQGSTTSIVVSSGIYTVTPPQAQASRIALTGTLAGAVTIQIPQKPGYFLFHDLTTNAVQRGYAITVSTGASGQRTQNIPAGLSHVFTDGAGVWLASGPQPGDMKASASPIAPPLWLYATGNTHSRTDYADLFAAVTFQTTGNVTSGSTSVTNIPTAPPWGNAWFGAIEGPGIPNGTTVASFSGSGPWTLTLSQAATATGTGVTITFLPHGQGDGSTTFNVPDLRGKSVFAPDQFGDAASAAGILNASSGFSTTRLGQAGGNQLLQTHNHGVTDPGHNHAVNDPGHNHSINDPGHAHGVYDPGHNHGQSPHSHVLYDAGHTHGVNDPGHTHYYSAMLDGGGSSNIGGGGARSSGGHNVNASGTGISIQTAGTGISVDGATANINAATTGIGIYASGTGISNNASKTGIYNSASGTGISIQNSGSGGSQNMPPALLANWLIYAGQ